MVQEGVAFQVDRLDVAYLHQVGPTINVRENSDKVSMTKIERAQFIIMLGTYPSRYARRSSLSTTRTHKLHEVLVRKRSTTK